jgi:hypothetical protein
VVWLLGERKRRSGVVGIAISAQALGQSDAGS